MENVYPVFGVEAMSCGMGATTVFHQHSCTHFHKKADTIFKESTGDLIYFW